MVHRLVYAALVAYVMVSVGVTAVTLTEPTIVSSTDTNWAITLSVQVARFSNDVLSFTSRQFCYNGIHHLTCLSWIGNIDIYC
jgi:hypothetical protein